MKKIVGGIVLLLSLQSCYNTHLLVGNIEKTDPVVEVQKVWNHHLLYGLVPLNSATLKTENYIIDEKNYVVKTNIGLAQGVIQCLTFGIYTPTQTTYYVPLKAFQEEMKHNVDYK